MVEDGAINAITLQNTLERFPTLHPMVGNTHTACICVGRTIAGHANGTRHAQTLTNRQLTSREGVALLQFANTHAKTTGDAS